MDNDPFDPIAFKTPNFEFHYKPGTKDVCGYVLYEKAIACTKCGYVRSKDESN